MARIAQIMGIVARFGFDDFVEMIRSKENIPIRPFRHKEPGIEHKSRPERVRLMFEELGTTFVKFGQILSTRGDIVGVTYAAELAKLQDSMKPFPGDEAKRIIEAELGVSVEKLFSHFDSKPLASASIAQVHRATLRSGKKVVIKVQRPGIEGTVREDLRIMHYLADVAEKHIPEAAVYDPVYLVNEFERSILKELDFQREGKNALRLRENFKKEKWIYIPKVYEELTTKRVLTMEEMRGTKLIDVIESKSGSFDKELIAHRIAEAFFKMVLVDGIYHADPHPGNILVLKGDVICFLDYGRVGTIDKEVAENIFRFALFAVDNDVNGLIQHLIRTNMLEDSGDMDLLKADVSDLLETYYSTNIKDVKIGYMLSDLVSVISKYKFNRPRELAELTRTLLILEGVGMQLSPKFSIADEFEPYAKRILPSSLNLQKIANTITTNIIDFEYIARTFPMVIRRFLKKLDEGKIHI